MYNEGDINPLHLIYKQMMHKKDLIEWSTISLLLFLQLFSCSSGNNPDDNVEKKAPELVFSSPTNGATNWVTGETTLSLRFNQDITLTLPHNITLNGNDVISASTSGKELKVNVNLKPGTIYSLTIPAGKVKGIYGLYASVVNISFKTEGKKEQVIKTNLVVPNPTKEVKNVYIFFRDNYGKTLISGTMANVSWNINEAEWVYKHTGKYPALNCFDFIFHHYSPNSWIDYNNTEIVENWWNNNGLVAAMWHWNVPANSGIGDAASFYYGPEPEKTLFDVSKISDTNSTEYKLMIKDIDEVAGYLKLLKNKNIPVIWRPLHEAAGNTNSYPGGTAWFWWGAKGAGPFKALWKLMYERMTNIHQLNNLIWVWTTENNDPDWYPGDEYVDIIGRDIYNKTATSQILTEFDKLVEKYPDKIITLSECGNVANITDQWNSGSKWSWFMPWYDFDRTVNTSSSAFLETSHVHANIDWWKNALNNPIVLTRDEMPNLK